MQKRAPTLGNLLVIVLFVLSCFGLLMFLWESFGGPLPLKAKGYRFTVAYPKTLALAEQSDVRISGVDVGHVVSIHLGSDGRTHATIEIAEPIRPDPREHARDPAPEDAARGDLRAADPAGQRQRGRSWPTARSCPTRQVEPTVTLDDILSAFDAKTRARVQDLAAVGRRSAIAGRGEQINASFAQLEPFVEHANQLLSILDSQEGAVREVVHNTGVVFNALASRDHQLEEPIVNGEHTFHAAAEASEAFADTFRALPAFEHNSTVALKETDKFAEVANPYFEEFRPAERQLSKLLTGGEAVRAGIQQLPDLARAADRRPPKTGLPDVKKTLDLTVPILENLRPVLHNLDPFLQFTGRVRARGAGVLRQPHRCHRGEPERKRQHRAAKEPQAALPDDDVGAQPAKASRSTPAGSAPNRGNAYPLPGTYTRLRAGCRCSARAPARTRRRP